ncbi:MAG: photosynthetic complex putative assembly protein PuhB [Pseudomonadota bacterium]
MNNAVNEEHLPMDGEAEYGLPEHLPMDEKILWQGTPEFRTLARRVFRLRLVGIYFIALFGIHMTLQYESGLGLGTQLLSNSWMLVLASVAMLLLAGLALAYARTTVYTITSKRIVMRFGVALPMVINIPLPLVQSADKRRFEDGSGDIILSLKNSKTVSYLILWPNVNPWSFLPPKPTLRSLPALDDAAEALANAADMSELAADETARVQKTISVPTRDHNDELLGAV